jgi:hypothetical protein
MSIWALLAIALISLAGKSFGYALTLAGVAGLVISLGVTADSYIVFFERLKDEVRAGRRCARRSSRRSSGPSARSSRRHRDGDRGGRAVLHRGELRAWVRLDARRGHSPGPVRRVLLQASDGLPDRASKRLSAMRGFGLESATGADHIEQPEAAR